jgi:hypothetical protein
MEFLDGVLQGLVGASVLALVGLTVLGLNGDAPPMALRLGVVALVLGSALAGRHDHRTGHFGNNRLGPASAVMMVAWTFLVLALATGIVTRGSASGQHR